ncbi:MAG: DUF3106 domain-containing protein [Verrucomicrobia bacterium]|nr:DUF3106 domain-containing protein [Verrucomicrobiota bacterium]
MNCEPCKGGWLVTTLGLSWLLVLPAFSQAEGKTTVPTVTSNSRNDSAAPPLPLTRSPIESFRELLVMPVEERNKALAIRPPEAQRRILAKVHEYTALNPEERELRLLATELQWYLLLLMNAPATNRAAQLELIPAQMRELVKDRLQRWDLLPPPLRQQMRESGHAVAYFSQVNAGAGREHVISEDQRRKLTERFNRFIELTPREREKALGTLSDAERRQMEKTLDAFSALTPRQRDQCLRSFASFAGLSQPEREQFLQNAERWAQMSLAERHAWRELVSRVPKMPPLPPSLMPASLRPPPLPPAPGTSAAAATNRN